MARTSNFDWSRAGEKLLAVVGATAAGQLSFAGSLCLAERLLYTYGISTHYGAGGTLKRLFKNASVSAIGFFAVGLSGVVAGQSTIFVARLIETRDLNEARKIWRGWWGLGVDFGSAVLVHRFVIGRPFRFVAPSDLAHVGKYGQHRHRVLATEETYASKVQREHISDLGRFFGCHSCGTRKASAYHADHQPPVSLNPKGGTMYFYPHCKDCSNAQGGSLSGKNFSPSNRPPPLPVRSRLDPFQLFLKYHLWVPTQLIWDSVICFFFLSPAQRLIWESALRQTTVNATGLTAQAVSYAALVALQTTTERLKEVHEHHRQGK
mmetsp:Transcript_16125/g.27831  ORF Transcript_16125/g.27831 Transcript_16125/m.27831 type:complete len:321 (-) Transcript_16125:5-967(-)